MARVWGSDEWEEYLHKLLAHHYGPSEYQVVPDEHVGDYGIESYTENGHAFQFYVCQPGLTAKKRYEKQRNKITADAAKFVKNCKELSKVFGRVKISRWMFMVPKYDSARLPQHASKKTREVREEDLPYVADDFQIKIATDESYSAAKEALASAGVGDIRYDPEIPSGAGEKWLEEKSDSELVDNLDRKTSAVRIGADESELQKLRRRVVRAYLRGESILGRLYQEYPDIYEDVREILLGRERILEVASGMSVQSGQRSIRSEMEKVQESVKEGAPALGDSTIGEITAYAVADWIVRCPLEPEPQSRS